METELVGTDEFVFTPSIPLPVLEKKTLYQCVVIEMMDCVIVSRLGRE